MEQMQTSAKSQQSQYENIPTLQGPASQSGGFFFFCKVQQYLAYWKSFQQTSITPE